MTTDATEPEEEEFDSWIAHNTTYIEETKQLLAEYVEHQSFEKLKEQVQEENILNKQTSKYRRDVLREVARLYIPSKVEFIETPLMRAVTSDVDDAVKDWLIYYEFSQNHLLYTLTTELLYPEYTAGTMYVEASDIQGFIRQLEDDHPEISEWSQSTVEEASTKYLSALKNFGLLKGVQRKEFAVFYVPDEVIAYVFYQIAGDQQPTVEEIVEHPDWQLFLFDTNEVRRRLEGISPRYIRYERRGSTERIEPEFDNIWEVIDEFQY
ncbi:BrxA family protein [Halomarina pelagica]|uniref:BrxA family protein n=1 Tax=Halomarina pelagica TaxID=2961599 RepID=UPI0020C58496|nr:BrxA family protein [Halomarina sp. BND7]